MSTVRRHRVSIICLITFQLLALAAGSSSAQDLVRPGDPSLSPERIPLGVDTIAVLITPPGGTEEVYSTIVRRVERISDGGEALIRETQQGIVHATGGVDCDTLEVEAATLTFRRVVERTIVVPGAAPRVYAVRAGWGRLQGTITVASARLRPLDIAATPFFHVMATEALIAAWPIHERRAIRVSLLRLPAGTVHDVEYHVEGADVLRTAEGAVPCLVVRGPAAATLWLAQDDGRLVRMRWSLPSGATVWKLPARDIPYR